MSETRGVFSVRELYGLKIEDKWINPEDTWLSPSPFYGESLNNGYFGGRNDPSFKMDFSSDSVSNTPSIPNSVYAGECWSVGNQFFGYLAGLPSQTPASSTKITYSTSSSELIPTISTLSTPGSSQSAAVGNETNGYVGTNYNQSLIHKITYSTDNVEALPSATSNYYGDEWYRYATVGNTADGYFIGGRSDVNYGTAIEKITYSTENFSNVTNTGITRKASQTVASGNATAGYISGINDNPSTLMQKLTYSDESASYIPGSGPPYVSFPSPRSEELCSSGNSTHGYFLGGSDDTTAYGKIDYTTDTLASNTFLPNTSDYKREKLQGLGPRDNALPFSNVLFPAPSGPDVNLFNQSETPNIGYFGGNNNVLKNKYNFADETALLAPGAQHPNIRAKSGGNITHAYHFGDGPASPTYSTYKTEYATDTTGASSVATAPTGYERRNHKVIGNQTDAYLFGNSNYSLGKTYYDKFTYSTDTFATSPFPKAAPTPTNKNYQSKAAAIGNQTHGYLTGGEPTSSEIWRMVYSTDTIDSTPSANTQSPASNRRYCAGVGNGSAGYFCAGNTNSFEKFEYSNDTISSVPGLPLLSTNTGPAAGGATGNSTHGYINTLFYSTNMSKITYSTDTSSVAEDLINVGSENSNTGVGPRQFDLPFKGPLPPTPTSQNAVGSFPISNNGYFMGSSGNNPNKISFTDDSVSSVTTLSSHSTNYSPAGELQNSAHGYDIRKTNSGPDSKKIHFNIETDFLIPSITDSDALDGAIGSGNSTDGYLLGQSSNGSDNVDKLQYSTDTLSPLPVAPLVMGRHAAAGNSTHGYFAGGVSGSSSLQSHIQRIIYSTGTTEFVPSVNLSEAREYLAAAGNNTHGYFVGGDPANKTNVDRITYATNTGDVSSINMYPNTSLTPGQNGSIATGNSTYGYFNMSSNRLNKLEYTTSTSAPFPNSMTFAGYNFFLSPSFKSAFSAKENGFPQTGNANQFGPVNL